MTDVFISYSKPHRHLTETLAREIENMGLDVWWDTELLAGEAFRDRIMAELKRCRAAIVIWTPESIRSPYVLSEAERARREGKLIQVRTPDVAAEDLPPPFDTSHVPLVEDRRSIYGALGRLGLIDGQFLAAMGIAVPPPVSEPARPAWMRPAAGVALLAAVALGVLVWRLLGPQSVAPPDPVAVAADAFFAELASGLQSSGAFAPNVRLGRLGAMGRDEAAAEIRKLNDTYARIGCRREAAPASGGEKAAKAAQAVRRTIAVSCDLTDKAGRTSTRTFPLEVEVVADGRNGLISGLWQPQDEVLWTPPPRR